MFPEEVRCRVVVESMSDDPTADNVVWHNNGRERCGVYQFNTKQKDQLFCPKCGTSIGIDFREVHKPHTYGISARTIYGINLDELELKKFAGTDKVPPAGDLSGQWWDEEKQEMK
ncbi:putative glutathione-dependent formaldehyde-activating enzyme protein [Eutypa lata UCREL1]|uniref:Putative glutathione-dependent formaldehyde-activating enzyme protein n=1 Tax=Eutypa lata (strain UCR-EL1) TaxID=1287681 RepID=M7SU59_EUTLA|nr:putative glutathione-dependent formaldehyde-activating enzyme protein [Eutypa lata UCREL1]